jgi:hypothetical protein
VTIIIAPAHTFWHTLHSEEKTPKPASSLACGWHEEIQKGGFIDMNFIEFLSDKACSVPLWQLGLLVMINFGCLIAGKDRPGLEASCLFMLYWGFVLNNAYLVETLGLFPYVVSGALAVVAVMMSLFAENQR